MAEAHIANRDAVLKALKNELVGPCAGGEPVDLSRPLSFDTLNEAYAPHFDDATKQELLQRDPPTRRYGIGVLYPMGSGEATQSEPALSLTEAGPTGPDVLTNSAVDELTKILERKGEVIPEAETPEVDADRDQGDAEPLDLSSANTYNPSSLAVSFLADLTRHPKLEMRLSAGQYRRVAVSAGGRQLTWWLRRSVNSSWILDDNDLDKLRSGRPVKRRVKSAELAQLQAWMEIYPRPATEPGTHLITACIVNRTISGAVDETALFQVELQVTVSDASGRGAILPYPTPIFAAADLEEKSLSLLYRKVQTFAVGHGCAADWTAPEGAHRASQVSGVALPAFQAPSITPDIERPGNMEPLTAEMAPLAGLVSGDDGFGRLAELIALYNEWIHQRRLEAAGLEAAFKDAAEDHLLQCERVATRMSDGLTFLNANSRARTAFALANRAMLTQQVNATRERRTVEVDEKTGRSTILPAYNPPDLNGLAPAQGKWRPFQIAFLLMNVRSMAEPHASDSRHDTVELIWFPTGGGKTEAYLALAAYVMFCRRLAEPNDCGTTALMRYTLRLLTAQQFQRACRLVCAMEAMRRERRVELGTEPFSVGIWLGESTTPNTRAQARTLLRKLVAGKDVGNKFLVTECPWCKAPMGPQKIKKRSIVYGYSQKGNTVALSCPDSACPFGSSLPVLVIDEDIYDSPPTFLIGTVDKFAMLAWRSAARSIFGRDIAGKQEVSPPSLIIQDELHLISGPLGSMVGLYEAVIQELCTDRRHHRPIVPKIVCSTATIRNYAEQVLSLYGRTSAALFPPPGLEAGDSFFARYARDKATGELLPGRMYVGVHGPGLGSLQTAQVRTIAALLQAPQPFSAEARDPWWTTLLFFNSLRELGSTLSLVQSDIPDYLRVLRNRYAIEWSHLRQLRHVEELTSRLKDNEVPEAITKLEQATTSSREVVDLCLASNIIEVGVDIDRLSLMAVIGQPKTTAQYIQVTGRVGRKWWERPGLVVTIYAASKSRDRSHFEKFRSYHERLYAQVEPTSVTPFSLPVLERALHGAVAAFVRQAGSEEQAECPWPLPTALLDQIGRLFEERVKEIDEECLQHLRSVLGRRLREWEGWRPREWTGSNDDYEVPLLYAAGSYVDARTALRSWATPMSMRNVDAECQAEITALFPPVPGAATYA